MNDTASTKDGRARTTASARNTLPAQRYLGDNILLRCSMTDCIAQYLPVLSPWRNESVTAAVASGSVFAAPFPSRASEHVLARLHPTGDPTRRTPATCCGNWARSSPVSRYHCVRTVGGSPRTIESPNDSSHCPDRARCSLITAM